MDGLWLFRRSTYRFGLVSSMVVSLLYQNLCLCWSLNGEGLALLKFRERVVNDPYGALSNWNGDNGDVNPCSWYGVECSEGKVVVLNLRDLCLGGTLAPEFRNLLQIKTIILRNNSFHGIIPKEIGEMKELEVLDLGYNNFSGDIAINLGHNLSLTILLLDNNGELGRTSPEIEELQKLNQLSDADKRFSCKTRFNTWSNAEIKHADYRKLMGVAKSRAHPLHVSNTGEEILPTGKKKDTASQSSSPSPSPSPSPYLPPPSLSASNGSSSSNSKVVILAGVVGGSIFISIVIIGIWVWKNKKGTTIKPWATGLSGQLQKAFVTGVPKLNRSEVETACEDFSNVIVSSPVGPVYKGTLSNGVEIAVTSVVAKSSSEWSMKLEEQFRKKILSLSKVNHRNFDNLLGFCEEEEPFTRMMVFEYAPNGTLFEHLHVQEAEHLDWGMRLRIAMGMAYCLEHMHQLTPPIAHTNLNSSSVNLTEDYAAKVSDFSFWNSSSEVSSESLESNVYNFGVILFEMVTGRVPYSVDNSSHGDWASAFLKEGRGDLKEIIDPTLNTFQEEQLQAIGQVIKTCVCPNHRWRPTMKDVTERLKDITAIGSDGATPRQSALWWAELEIQSTGEANI